MVPKAHYTLLQRLNASSHTFLPTRVAPIADVETAETHTSSLDVCLWHLRLFFRASAPPLRDHFSIVCCPLCSAQRSGSVPLLEAAGFTAETAETFVGTLHDNRVRAALPLPSGWS